MTVELGTVQTLPDVKPDKAQALKVLEEAAEVFGAWQRWDAMEGGIAALKDECVDVIQATCNLLAAYGVRDFTWHMEMRQRSNVKRRRM